MDYEFNHKDSSIHTRIYIILAIGFIIGFYVGLPLAEKLVDKNKPNTTSVNHSIAEVVEIKYVYITVTPTPDGKLYFASEYESGIRKLQREFSISRKNATGYQTAVIHANVYDYRIMDSYHWFNPTDYTYYEEYPSSLDKKFLFVFTYIYEDEILGDDTRFYVPKIKQFNVQSQNKLYSAIEFPKQLRIKELEDVYNSNDDARVQYYNTYRGYSSSDTNVKTAGEFSYDLDLLYGGKSNKIDGYIIFEIDKEDKPEDLMVNVNYYGLGDSTWKLKV